MKREVLFIILALIFILPLATALNGTLKDKAYGCIENAVKEKGCDDFGFEDKIFSLLSTGKCKQELLDSAINNECFGLQTSCTLKITSQSVLALDEANSNTDEYVNWLLNQNTTGTGLDWLLQIDIAKSGESAECTVYDSDDKVYHVIINENREISISGTPCLGVDTTGYWLEINPSCYNQAFDITCDKDFLTSLLFKKGTAYYVSAGGVQQSSGGGSNTEEFESLCFKQGASCNYEGNLWTALVLKQLGYDISSYLPYLIAFEEDNEEYLPEAFLYYLTGEEYFKTELILKQKRQKYWDEKYDRYYDTAVALLPLSGESEVKQNSIDWLTEEQGEDGCWNSGSMKHTGFLLYSLWPISISEGNGGETPEDCEDSDYYCVSSDIVCSESDGEVLGGYDCPGFDICCTEEEYAQTCVEDLEGEICDYNQECVGGYEEDTPDLAYDETCCIGGGCQETGPSADDTCTPEGGICRDVSCEDNEEVDFVYECLDTYQNCCMPKTKQSHWWLWVLIILIILVVVAIKFKDKLRDFYYKLNFKKKPATPARPGIHQAMPPRRAMPLRRILLQQSAPVRRPPAPERQSDVDEVLKKLKEMGK